jgi:hypothetical protein
VAGELIGKEGKKEGRGIDFTADNGWPNRDLVLLGRWKEIQPDKRRIQHTVWFALIKRIGVLDISKLFRDICLFGDVCDFGFLRRQCTSNVIFYVCWNCGAHTGSNGRIDKLLKR